MSSDTSYHLRLLATADIHMHLLPHDYRRDAPDSARGLAGLVPLIDAARAEVPDALCLLLDNGDMLQGSELGVTLSMDSDLAPLHHVLDQLRYDALGLGNHDFDFGLDYLARHIAGVRAPVLCSNFEGAGALPHLLLDRQLGGHPIRIGLVSVLPPQTVIWNALHLGTASPPCDMVSATRRAVDTLRSEGADVVVLLAHTGLAPPGIPEDENAARPLAALPGIDAMICGHTHRRLPGSDHADWPGVDAPGGYVAGVPSVMPGFAASDLGVIDLALERSGDGWNVRSSRTALRRNSGQSAPWVAKMLAAPHAQTRTRQADVLSHSDKPLHSFFAALRPDAGQFLIAEAIQTEIKRALPALDVPILAAVAPNAAGGRGGPTNYLNLAAGPILRRHVTTILPYSNHIWALEITGAELRQWVEMAACYFHKVTPDDCAALVDTAFPSFNFDTVFGVEAVLDPSQDAGFVPTGAHSVGGGRVKRLLWNGAEVTESQRFVLGTTSYRAAGGGGFPGAALNRTVLQLDEQITDAVVRHLQDSPLQLPDTVPWRFETAQPVRTWFDTSPMAGARLDEIAAHSPEVLGQTEDGFLRVAVTL